LFRLKLGIQRKFLLTIIYVALIPLFFAGIITYFTSRYVFIQNVSGEFKLLAEQKANTVNNALIQEIDKVNNFAETPDIITAVSVQNKTYESKSPPQIVDILKNNEKRWRKVKNAKWCTRCHNVPQFKSEPNNADNDFILKYTNNPVAQKLATFHISNPRKNISMSIYDKYGGLVSASDKVPNFDVSSTGWFKSAIRLKGKTEISDFFTYGQSNHKVISISAPILDGELKTVGAIHFVLNINSTISEIINTPFGKTGHFHMVSENGEIISNPPEYDETLSRNTILMALKSGKSFIQIKEKGKEELSAGVSRVQKLKEASDSGFNSRKWYVFTEKKTSEVLSPLIKIMFIAGMPALFVIAIIAIIGAYASKRLVEPIERLKNGALVIGKGNLDYRLNISTGDETEELSNAFNSMAENLKISDNNLRSQADKLRTTNEQLEAANKLKSEFLANMSHELRTPMNSIIGFAEVLNDKIFGDLNEKQLKYINNIHSSGKHLLNLINDILDLSKVEAGKMDLSLEKFSVARALTDIETIIWPLAGKKNLNLSVQKGESLPEITADLGKFKQIMYNLLSNAVKFTPESGSVSVTSDIREGFLEINVTDSGIGIKPEYAELIFEEFKQIDDSLSREYEGTGLGLALTKKLVELHGGRIWVNSELGEGSTFTFIIPIDGSAVSADNIVHVQPGAMEAVSLPKLTQPSNQPSSEKELVSLKNEGTGPLILVVEDDLKSSELMQVYLTQAGYEVDYAYDGEQAVEKAGKLKPMAIILDIMLPKKDGWTVLQELKANPSTANIPVIITSMIDNAELGFALGAIDYIVKPVDKHTLIDHLKKHSFTTKVKTAPFSILVVDDDPNSVELLSAILEPEGFGLLKAYGGEEAIKISKEAAPDLIILDLMMPKVNGFQVVNELRQNIHTKNIPIVVFTAKQLTKEDVAQLNSHISKIIKKAEFSKEDLLEEIYKFEQLKPEHANLVDELTGIFNRRYFLKRLSRERKESEHSRRTFALLMVDIDNFKKFNEIHGRDAGDEALKKISLSFKSSLRKNDFVARLESDNFAIILPETTKESAIRVSEKLTRNMQSLNIDDKFRLSIAIGIANYFQDAGDKEQLIEKALENLRTAMLSGGDKIYPEKVKTQS
jgi:diguanylate cyclase (GGDEF)-like protein